MYYFRNHIKIIHEKINWTSKMIRVRYDDTISRFQGKPKRQQMSLWNLNKLKTKKKKIINKSLVYNLDAIIHQQCINYKSYSVIIKK